MCFDLGGHPVGCLLPAHAARVTEGRLGWVEQGLVPALATEDVTPEVARVADDRPHRACRPSMSGTVRVPARIVRARAGHTLGRQEARDRFESAAIVQIKVEE